MRDLTKSDINQHWNEYIQKELFLDMYSYPEFEKIFLIDNLTIPDIIRIMKYEYDTILGKELWEQFKLNEERIKEIILKNKNEYNLNQHLATYY